MEVLARRVVSARPVIGRRGVRLSAGSLRRCHRAGGADLLVDPMPGTDLGRLGKTSGL